MKKKYYVLTAVISYFVLLIMTIPAKPVTDLINNKTDISINGVSGSLWNGHAYSINIGGKIELNDTHWSFVTWKMLIGQLALDLNSHYLENEIDTEASISVSGRVYVSSLTASMTASQLAELTNIPLVQLDGDISLDIDSAQWKQGELPLASGQINWTNAMVTVTEAVSLGNVSIILSESEQNTQTAYITNTEGEITIVGNAGLIPEQDYSVDLRMTPAASARNSIKQSLGMIAKRQSNGDYLLKNTGSLKTIGLM
jgi:general secretion pathway protein N